MKSLLLKLDEKTFDKLSKEKTRLRILRSDKTTISDLIRTYIEQGLKSNK